jgi:hypothetical protein
MNVDKVTTCINCGKEGRLLDPQDNKGERILCEKCYLGIKYKNIPRLTKTLLDKLFPLDPTLSETALNYHKMRRASMMDAAGVPWQTSNGRLRSGLDLPEAPISQKEVDDKDSNKSANQHAYMEFKQKTLRILNKVAKK